MISAGRLALVGSGEYLPVMQEIEEWLLQNRPARYVQLATAAAPEGQRSLDNWHRLGAQAAQRLGVEQVVLDVRTQEHANDSKWADLVSGAGLIYLSGGNPGFLARTLAGTLVWQAIEREWRLGASLAGCSAGAMALAGYVPDFRHPRAGGVYGLGVIPDIRVLPHFDRYTKWVPDFAMRPLLAPGTYIVGIDEDTALIGESSTDTEVKDGLETWQFRARGRQSAWRIEADRRYRINSALDLRVNTGT
ncbi:MAG: Type 1 glutamine amidotransferase-like domain-containing protein [Actinomycetota bacterium]|nr:Type 1 glutamine amidotransferase-like domain-containing protein [Actinomycetota bacterium]